MQARSLVTALALVMAISMLGSAVAMWYDVLKIHATVYTGEVDVEFGEAWCVEAPEAEGKDVGSCSVDLDEVRTEGPDDNDLDMVITISNAYPGYSCIVYFEVINAGTIPVKGPFTGTGLGIFPQVSYIDMDGDGDGDVEIRYNLPMVQIDPEDTYEFSITFTVIQPAPESFNYELQVHLYFVQWNEVETTSPA